MCLVVTGHFRLAAEMAPTMVGARVAGARSPAWETRPFLKRLERLDGTRSKQLRMGLDASALGKINLAAIHMGCLVMPGHKPGQRGSARASPAGQLVSDQDAAISTRFGALVAPAVRPLIPLGSEAGIKRADISDVRPSSLLTPQPFGSCGGRTGCTPKRPPEERSKSRTGQARRCR